MTLSLSKETYNPNEIQEVRCQHEKIDNAWHRDTFIKQYNPLFICGNYIPNPEFDQWRCRQQKVANKNRVI